MPPRAATAAKRRRSAQARARPPAEEPARHRCRPRSSSSRGCRRGRARPSRQPPRKADLPWRRGRHRAGPRGRGPAEPKSLGHDQVGRLRCGRTSIPLRRSPVGSTGIRTIHWHRPETRSSPGGPAGRSTMPSRRSTDLKTTTRHHIYFCLSRQRLNSGQRSRENAHRRDCAMDGRRRRPGRPQANTRRWRKPSPASCGSAS